MAEFKLTAGATLDLLTKQEVKDSLQSWWNDAQVTRMAGVKYMRQVVPVNSTTTATINGPDLGYAWNLKLVSGLLTGSDSVAVYVGDSTASRLIGYAPAPGAAPAQNLFVITWSSDQVILNPGEGIFLATSGAFRFTQVMTTAVQVPAELIGKVLS